MKFLSIWTPGPKTAGSPPSQEHMAEMDKLIAAESNSGYLLATGALLPTSQGGARVRSADGKITIVDGPFPEAKEVIAGFAVLEASSKEEAIEGIRRFLRIAGDGEAILRQILEPADDFPKL